MEELIARKVYLYRAIDKTRMNIMRLRDSRDWLKSMGINDQISQTFSHGDQSIALLLDSGEAFIGDMPVLEEYSELARSDWNRIRSLEARSIYPAHAEHFEIAEGYPQGPLLPRESSSSEY